MGTCCSQRSGLIQFSVRKACPACNKVGQSVSTKTVESLTQRQGQVGDEEFHICMNPECKVVYYSDTVVFEEEKLIVPVWFKTGADPVILCYCNNLTAEDVKRACMETDSNDYHTIMSHLGGMHSCNCELNNPTGNCCISTIKGFIEKECQRNGK